MKTFFHKILVAIKNRNLVYYILFFILFYMFFGLNFTSRPHDLSEVFWFDLDIRLLEYKNNNDLTLEQTRTLWNSTSFYGMERPITDVTIALYSSPLYSLIRAYTLKIPLHLMTTLNTLNLIIAILFFYSAYLLIQLLFGHSIAIKSLLVLLSFYPVYTVTRFSERGYIVIGLGFTLLGCYYIWKSVVAERRRHLIYAGIFMGLAWSTGNHLGRLMPPFLLITLAFYVFNYLRKYNFVFSNKICGRIALDILLVIGFLFFTSAIITAVVVHYFGLDSFKVYGVSPLFFNTAFRVETPWGPWADVSMSELFRRLHLFLFFPSRGDVMNHFDEYLYSKSVIPEVFILFLFLSLFYLRKSLVKLNYMLYMLIFAIIPFLLMPILPQWEIRYHLIFLPFLALFTVFGIEYCFSLMARKITNNRFRIIVSSIVIMIIIPVYLTRIYDITLGNYAKSWNHSDVVTGSRSVTDALSLFYKRYDKSITLLKGPINCMFIQAYLDFDPNHSFEQIAITWDTTKMERFLPVLFEKYTKNNGKIFVVADKEYYDALTNAFPKKVELDLIEYLQFPKLDTLENPKGTPVALYSMRGFSDKE